MKEVSYSLNSATKKWEIWGVDENNNFVVKPVPEQLELDFHEPLPKYPPRRVG